ncbi:MAG: T9SS type A sorting domain-containing protein [Ignavibacteria bacterium]|nr:T9SS type A sorting domain-containing protein [Ignavibacteria bacterium]
MNVSNSRVFFRRRTIAPIGINYNNNQNPVSFALFQNYPNPFNPVTNIKFDIPKQQSVKLIVYDISGRETQTILNKSLSPGSYSIQYNASNLSSGVYFYKLETEGFTESKKMIVVK